MHNRRNPKQERPNETTASLFGRWILRGGGRWHTLVSDRGRRSLPGNASICHRPEVSTQNPPGVTRKTTPKNPPKEPHPPDQPRTADLTPRTNPQRRRPAPRNEPR